MEKWVLSYVNILRASLTGILVNFIFKNDTNKLIYKTERDSELEKEFMIRRVEGGGKEC